VRSRLADPHAERPSRGAPRRHPGRATIAAHYVPSLGRGAEGE
jgi:hypothetical protein